VEEQSVTVGTEKDGVIALMHDQFFYADGLSVLKSFEKKRLATGELHSL
jgi:hypothetical protein